MPCFEIDTTQLLPDTRYCFRVIAVPNSITESGCPDYSNVGAGTGNSNTNECTGVIIITMQTIQSNPTQSNILITQNNNIVNIQSITVTVVDANGNDVVSDSSASFLTQHPTIEPNVYLRIDVVGENCTSTRNVTLPFSPIVGNTVNENITL